jgi:nicotinate-nucleotide adenylyltransferase
VARFANKAIRIGILGGSFDPVHRGHLLLAKSAVKELKLTQLFFVPAKQSPFKLEQRAVSTKMRLRLLRCVQDQVPRSNISSRELNAKGPSYTFRTIQYFHRRFPKAELFLILGSDTLKHFHRWKHYSILLQHCCLAVGKRGGQRLLLGPLPKRVRKKIIWLKSKMLAISSTQVRRQLRLKASPLTPREGLARLSLLIPPPVLKIILKHRLYQ